MAGERTNDGVSCRSISALLVALAIGATALSQSSANVGDAGAFREGQAAFQRNDLAEAQTAFEQAVRQAPHDERALAALGTVLLRRGQPDSAVRILQTAHAMTKADLNATLNLALAYQALGQQTKAAPLLAEVITGAQSSRQPVSAFVRAAYARSLAAMGRLDQAAIQMEAAVRTAPTDADLVGELGAIYAQQKNWPRAENDFRKQVALQPKVALAHLRLGLAMEAQGEPGALQELSEAAQLAPDQPAVQMEWGRALAAAGQDGQAIPVLQHVLAVQPDFLPALDQLAQAYQRTNRIPEAMNLYRKELATEPNNVAALTNLGMAYEQSQEAKEAVPYLQKAVGLAPQNVTAHENLAAAYVQLSQFNDAAAELRLALNLSPDSSQLHYDLGLALKSEDDAAGAIPELEKAQQLDPSAPEAPYLLGVLYMQAARYADASRELQASLKLRAENADGWATLGSVYNKLDQLPEAAAALSEAIRQSPAQPDPHLTLAAVLAKQGQTAPAAEERKQAADLMRANMNRQRAEVATNAGRNLLKNGDLDGASQQFHEALSYDATYADAHLGLASVYEAQGHAADAATERQKAGEAGIVKP